MIPGPGRFPGEGNGNPLLYSCLENSMDTGVWWATVQESDMTERQTHNMHTFLPSEIEMPAASVLRAESRKGAKDLTVYHAICSSDPHFQFSILSSSSILDVS